MEMNKDNNNTHPEFGAMHGSVFGRVLGTAHGVDVLFKGTNVFLTSQSKTFWKTIAGDMRPHEYLEMDFNNIFDKLNGKTYDDKKLPLFIILKFLDDKKITFYNLSTQCRDGKFIAINVEINP
ncbi:MAG: hypothetical protein A2452_08970 [Candidatus Firestonebacteria bacterium RIFOXYC2_FULL_39_67]|nr:MAG: hypothetical protein A2536_09530 [Candidatus Firestonebacteria bacterium RIFOXYD2_FULL_39_29]OGF53581.1 MAG: hypothetical protein A2452_08970 [Candidatus Firestonebacteria bacterium RIFOXYC2_FULL_39_67]